MDLTNDSVDPAGLPALDAAALHPVSPLYARYRLLSLPLHVAMPALVFWLALSFGALADPLWKLLLPAALALAVAAALLGFLEARRRAYGLREEDVIYRSGLLIRRTSIVPAARIQHVELSSGPLERAFGLVRLTCYTAGGAAGGVVLHGLEQETAERVRQYLLERIRQRDASRTADA
jgi:uncharacterized protein